METPGPKPRVVLPLSRVILLLLVGAVFIFRGVAVLVGGQPLTALPVVFILIGVLLLAGSAVMIVLRLRTRRD
jgi:hypothetical protein